MATESELLRGSDTLPKLLIDSHRRTVERSIDAVLHPIGMHVGNLAHIPVDILQRMLNGIDELERELASLRQKQVLWEAGNRELADRLEARDVAIDALRAEKERAEAERDAALKEAERFQLVMADIPNIYTAMFGD